MPLLVATVSVALAVLAFAAPARAYPFLSLRPGGTPFEGPTDSELSAIWYNPAALGELRGLHLGGTAQLLLERGHIARDPICLDTGLPGTCSDARGFPSVPISGLTPTGLGGLAWDFRQENLTIAFGVYAPWQAKRQFSDGGVGSTGTPTAYHLRSEDFRTLYYALALAVKVSQRISLGASVAVVDSSATLRFDRDTALDEGSATVGASGYENPAYAQGIRVHGDGGKFWGAIPVPSGLAINLGVLYRVTDHVTLGASWQRMFAFTGSSGHYSLRSAVGATITPSETQVAALSNPCSGGSCLGGTSIDYAIPDVWQLGARFALTPTLDLSTAARVVVYGTYQRNAAADQALVLRFSGEAVTRGLVPGRVLIANGLRPTVAGELGLRWRVIPSLRLGLSLAAESAAVPASLVNAAALDGPKLSGLLGAEWRVPFHFLGDERAVRLYGGYGLDALLLLRANSPHPGGFDPGATMRCVDAAYDLDACQAALAGRGLPSNAGSYALYGHHFDFGLTFDF